MKLMYMYLHSMRINVKFEDTKGGNQKDGQYNDTKEKRRKDKPWHT
jgi:hypothetical protein